MTIIGNPKIVLHFSTEDDDTNFMVTLRDINPRGDTLYLTLGVLRASLRQIGTARTWPDEINPSYREVEKVEPGTVHEMRFPLLTLDPRALPVQARPAQAARERGRRTRAFVRRLVEPVIPKSRGIRQQLARRPPAMRVPPAGWQDCQSTSVCCNVTAPLTPLLYGFFRCRPMQWRASGPSESMSRGRQE
ncbi:MAG: hypothetical protein M3O07_11400 [Pseudomonadota bacterium]|nr:hypothetical protein [Pseudomonadota bacterium]